MASKSGQNDYSNFQNTIKRTFPEFDDISARVPGAEANFTQSLMNQLLNDENPVDQFGRNMFSRFTLAEGAKDV